MYYPSSISTPYLRSKKYDFSPNTSIENIDLKDSVLLIKFWKNVIARLSPSLMSTIEIDSTSSSHFEIKSETSIVEQSLYTISELIGEEGLAIEMLEHDRVVKMPPKKRYKVKATVTKIRKG
ncbi:MAG: hypothetical protein ACTSYD_11510 [Candidatus Heimdallarchaeaceae archaeon]